MREFAVYTLLRLGLLLAAFVVVAGAWALLAGDGGVPLIPVLLIAIVGSGVASYFVLNRQREQLAQRMQHGAERASARFDDIRAREDAEE